jgi:hypothetical protein
MKTEYSNASADDLTLQLGNYYSRQLEILTDRKKGVIRTLFGILSGAIFSDVSQLRDAVLEKSGIQRIKADGPVCYDYLQDIITVTEARGSNAAEKIKQYKNFTQACDQTAATTPGYKDMNGFAKARLKTQIAKIQPL